MGLLSSTLLLMCIAIFGLACANVKLCVTSPQEMTKCNTFNSVTCVLGTDSIDCVNKINNNAADVTVLDGGDIYLAGKCHSMKPILSENTGETPPGVGYYAVAVAKKSSHVTIKNLEGTKSCHTGVNKTSGWFVPMSVLFPHQNNQLQLASAFFNKSCVPGATPGSNLCQLCTPNCDRNSNNLYYGYSGAAKCLEETDADVAFVKHLTFLTNPAKSNYELLCKDGSTANIENYEICNLAKVPSHAVVGKDSLSKKEIMAISLTFKKNKGALFVDTYGKNLIFSSSTTSLKKVGKTDYVSYLGTDYINALPDQVC